ADRQAQRETAVMMLLDDFPPHFALLDGYDSGADGLMGVMGCPRPPAPRRFYAGADALAVDLVAGRHLGLAHPNQSRLLQAACHPPCPWLVPGLPSASSKRDRAREASPPGWSSMACRSMPGPTSCSTGPAWSGPFGPSAWSWPNTSPSGASRTSTRSRRPTA